MKKLLAFLLAGMMAFSGMWKMQSFAAPVTLCASPARRSSAPRRQSAARPAAIASGKVHASRGADDLLAGEAAGLARHVLYYKTILYVRGKVKS